MKLDEYKVTCTKCGDSDLLKITADNTVFFTKHVPIIAARFRPDLNWGFECQCGQDSRVAPEEVDQVEILVTGGAHAVDAIKESLKIKDNTKFKMERI